MLNQDNIKKTFVTKSGKPLCYAGYKIYTPEDAHKLFRGRKIYIWGAGQKGRGFLGALERNNFNVAAFLDSSPSMVGTSYKGIPVLDSKKFLNQENVKETAYILTATVDSKNKDIFSLCEEAGLVKTEDFINIQELSPFYPTIEIAGVCNLKCLSCPRGNSLEPQENGGYMTLEDYSRVISKMIKEIPFLYLVDLYVWGEPLLNPKLPEIIRLNSSLGIASGISSNLNVSRNLESVIAANPAQFRISVSGFGEKNYEVSHKGARWEWIHKNMLSISQYKKIHKTETIIEVYYHVNQENIQEYPQMEKFCEDLGYVLHPSISMVFPDYALDYVQGKKLPPEALKALELMPISIEEMLFDARRDHNKSCLLKRIIPVINWDLSVLSCCNYNYHRIASNYLEISIQDIIDKRYGSDLCGTCQENSLHRYFNPVYYSDRVKKMVKV